MSFFFFWFKNTKYFNTHTHKGREWKVLKKLIVMYIQKGLTLGYTSLGVANGHIDRAK